MSSTTASARATRRPDRLRAAGWLFVASFVVFVALVLL